MARGDHSTPPGAVLLKICHSSTICRLRDGRIVAGSGHSVENPEGAGGGYLGRLMQTGS